MNETVDKTSALLAYYAALNGNDIVTACRLFADDVEWTEPADSPGAGTQRGLDAVRAHLEWARGTWAEGTCQPERFLAAGDRIVVFAFVRVRLRHEAEWRTGPIADVYTFRDGKVVQVRVFFDRQEALAWTGIEGEGDSNAVLPG